MEVRMLVSATETAALPVERAERAVREAFARIAVLDSVLSDYRKGSEVRRLEAAPKDVWVDISVELKTVLAAALEVARATGGQFDPTVGPVTRLWRDASRTGRPMDSAARADAMRRVDYRALELDTTRHRARLRRDSMALDLGAIAKGFVVDEALSVLRRSGVPAALVEAGGDIAGYGVPVGSAGWRVAVSRDDGDTVVVLRDAAISTSGDAAQSIQGRYGSSESHVLSPRSGASAPPGVAVTVTGSRAMITDALATALTLVGTRARDELSERFGVRVVAVRAGSMSRE